MTEKNLARFYGIAQEIWAQLPPQARFRPVEDGKVLARHRAFLEASPRLGAGLLRHPLRPSAYPCRF